MLLKYGARNFTSFKEGIEISLELGAKCPANISRGKSIAISFVLKEQMGQENRMLLRFLVF